MFLLNKNNLFNLALLASFSFLIIHAQAQANTATLLEDELNSFENHNENTTISRTSRLDDIYFYFLEERNLSKLSESIKSLIQTPDSRHLSLSLTQERKPLTGPFEEGGLDQVVDFTIRYVAIRKPNLREIFASEIGISKLPSAIGKFEELEELYLRGNKLRFLPIEIGNLKNLYKLNLSGNKLAFLPESIGKLQRLSELHVDHNRLRFLPGSILKTERHLKRLILHKNHFLENNLGRKKSKTSSLQLSCINFLISKKDQYGRQNHCPPLLEEQIEKASRVYRDSGLRMGEYAIRFRSINGVSEVPFGELMEDICNSYFSPLEIEGTRFFSISTSFLENLSH